MATDVDTNELRGPLPEDFPGRTALEAAGVDTYGKLRTQQNVTDIAGIGEVTAMKIKDRLEEDALAAKGRAARTENPGPAPTPADVAAATPVSDGQTQFEPPAAAVRVVCPVCKVGGEVAGDALIGTAVCGNPDHPETLLVRA